MEFKFDSLKTTQAAAILLSLTDGVMDRMRLLKLLMGDPARGELSKREMDKLKEVSERYRQISTPGLSAHTHEFPEWIKNFVPDTSRPIPWTDALKGTDGEDRIKLYEARLAEQDVLDSLFAIRGDDAVASGG